MLITESPVDTPYRSTKKCPRIAFHSVPTVTASLKGVGEELATGVAASAAEAVVAGATVAAFGAGLASGAQPLTVRARRPAASKAAQVNPLVPLMMHR
ncbi:hypothetical protein [Arthrobacter sp. KNU40]|uniref:hypothetical protein n=1 Tax=Arthrobacter sp. KNU40 TaxID=3447965 RepID=UPI003F5DD5B0